MSVTLRDRATIAMRGAMTLGATRMLAMEKRAKKEGRIPAAQEYQDLLEHEFGDLLNAIEREVDPRLHKLAEPLPFSDYNGAIAAILEECGVTVAYGTKVDLVALLTKGLHDEIARVPQLEYELERLKRADTDVGAEKLADSLTVAMTKADLETRVMIMRTLGKALEKWAPSAADYLSSYDGSTV